MTTHRRLVIAYLITAIGAGHARAQPAPEDTDKAAQLYEIGKRHLDIAEYAEAITSWKQAYLLSSEPLLLFNIAQAYRLSGDCAQANRFYLNYKRLVPKPANSVELDLAMAKCEGVPPATGDSSTAPPNTPVAASEPTGSEPPLVPPPVVPPPPPPHADHDEDPGRTLRLAGYITVGAGGVSLIVSVVSGLSARSDANKVSRQTKGTVWSPSLQQTQSNGTSAERRMWIFGGVGLAAVAAGGVMWWMGSHQSSHVDVAVVPGHAEVNLSCVF